MLFNLFVGFLEGLIAAFATIAILEAIFYLFPECFTVDEGVAEVFYLIMIISTSCIRAWERGFKC